MTNTNCNIRLKDPKGLLTNSQLAQYEEKFRINYLRLAFPARYGGNPLAFALTANKFHIIDDRLNPPTAATDGINFYWHPQRLEELSVDELFYVLEHEISHIALGHLLKSRIANKAKLLWNLAADFKVNSIQERSYRSRHPEHTKYDDFDHPLWKGSLGIPITLAEIKKLIANDKIDPKKLDIRVRPVDISLLDRSVESIYDELYEHAKNHGVLPRYDSSASDFNLDNIDIDIDEHIPLDVTETELATQLSQAGERVRMARGSMPAEVEDFLAKLTDPEISLIEFCRSSLKRSKRENGLHRNWAKFRRRYIHSKLYIPRSNNYDFNFLVLLDTSASMSSADMALGVSQLQSLSKASNGIVVPVDGEPHWKAATHINKIADIKKIRIVGRGGTVFDNFFKNYKNEVGDFDLIIVITDGFFGYLDPGLKPNCDVAWVVVNYSKSLTVPFGRIFPLRQSP